MGEDILMAVLVLTGEGFGIAVLWLASEDVCEGVSQLVGEGWGVRIFGRQF